MANANAGGRPRKSDPRINKITLSFSGSELDELKKSADGETLSLFAQKSLMTYLRMNHRNILNVLSESIKDKLSDSEQKPLGVQTLSENLLSDMRERLNELSDSDSGDKISNLQLLSEDILKQISTTAIAIDKLIPMVKNNLSTLGQRLVSIEENRSTQPIETKNQKLDEPPIPPFSSLKGEEDTLQKQSNKLYGLYLKTRGNYMDLKMSMPVGGTSTELNEALSKADEAKSKYIQFCKTNGITVRS